MYDICIIGAGPAGSTLARAVASKYRVLLVDRRTLDQPWAPGSAAKPCGGLLAPRAQAELARQGLGLPRDVLSGPQLFAVRTIDLETSLERLYQRFYVSVDRERFDRWLVSLLPDRIDTAFGWHADSIDKNGDTPLVHFSTPGGGHASVEARLVVGADGAASLARRTCVSSSRAPRHYTAVQAVFSAAWTEPHYGAVFDSGLDGLLRLDDSARRRPRRRSRVSAGTWGGRALRHVRRPRPRAWLRSWRRACAEQRPDLSAVAPSRYCVRHERHRARGRGRRPDQPVISGGHLLRLAQWRRTRCRAGVRHLRRDAPLSPCGIAAGGRGMRQARQVLRNLRAGTASHHHAQRDRGPGRESAQSQAIGGTAHTVTAACPAKRGFRE